MWSCREGWHRIEIVGTCCGRHEVKKAKVPMRVVLWRLAVTMHHMMSCSIACLISIRACRRMVHLAEAGVGSGQSPTL